jgi:hypothetical protein
LQRGIATIGHSGSRRACEAMGSAPNTIATSAHRVNDTAGDAQNASRHDRSVSARSDRRRTLRRETQDVATARTDRLFAALGDRGRCRRVEKLTDRRRAKRALATMRCDPAVIVIVGRAALAFAERGQRGIGMARDAAGALLFRMHELAVLEANLVMHDGQVREIRQLTGQRKRQQRRRSNAA